MKCVVCGKEFDAAVCPRCSYEDIQIPGVSAEEAKARLAPMIEAHRAKFMQSIQVELVCYHWKEQSGKVVLANKNMKSFGNAAALLQEEVWLGDWFARVENQERLSVTVRITAGREVSEQNIVLPNLPQRELQQIGAYVDKDFMLYLRLRNRSQTVDCVNPVPLFV